MQVRVLVDTELTAKAGSVVTIDDGALRFLSGRVEVIQDEPEAAPAPAAKPKAKTSKPDVKPKAKKAAK